MKPNFFVRALFALFLFTIIGFSTLAVALDFGLLPNPSMPNGMSTGTQTQTISLQTKLSQQLARHQIAANSYQQSLSRLRNRQVQLKQIGQDITITTQAENKSQTNKSQINNSEATEAVAPQVEQTQFSNRIKQTLSQKWSSQKLPTEQHISEIPLTDASPIVTTPLEAALPIEKPSPYDIIEAARKSSSPYSASLTQRTFTPPAFTPPRFAQEIPQRLGQTYSRARAIPWEVWSDRAKEQPVKIIESAKSLRPAVKRQVESAGDSFQQIPNRIKGQLKDQLSETLDKIGEKAHQTAEVLRDS